MARVMLGSKPIQRGSRDYYIIAEAGVNHEGSLDTARRLVDLAKEGGADAIKFQTYKAEKLTRKDSPAYWDLSKEPTRSQFELFKKYDAFSQTEYQALANHCRDIGIEFMTTAFDLESLKFVDPMVRVHKVASADLTNVPLLRALAATGKPVLLSTGASSFVEVDSARRLLLEAGADQVALLHCVLNYPTPADRAHLARISTLNRLFDQTVIGYSDHTLPGDFCYPVVLAYMLGARIIEKHFTHDRSLPGNDHYHAMDVHSLKGLRQHLDEAKVLLGSGDEHEFLKDQIAAIRHARRSIVSNGHIKAGQVLSESNMIVKRPGDGISPMLWDDIVGRKAAHDIPDDRPVTWRDIAPAEGSR